jgi:hypothetical protein
MGTSRRRTPPAPVSAGPLGRPDRFVAASKKLANRLLVSSWKPGIFCPRTNPWLPSAEHVFKVRQSQQERWKTSPRPHQTRRYVGKYAAAISWLSFDRQACKRSNSASASSTNRVSRWRCSAARSCALRSRPQCSITLRWLSTMKDRTLGGRSNTSVSGGNRTLVSTSDMIE